MPATALPQPRLASLSWPTRKPVARDIVIGRANECKECNEWARTRCDRLV